jgi:hypothetical protein
MEASSDRCLYCPDRLMNDIAAMVVGGIAIIIGFAAIVAYPALQYSALRQLRGVWFGLGLVPLGVMAVVGVLTAMALAKGANLWPLLLIFTAPLATTYLLLLRFAANYVGGRK